jgi:hypothetical protein
MILRMKGFTMILPMINPENPDSDRMCRINQNAIFKIKMQEE